MKLAAYSLLLILIISCNSKEQNQNNIEIETPFSEIKKVEKTTLKNFTYEDLAKYTMASIMGQPLKIIKVKKRDELYLVSYIRKSDHQRFDYKIKFDGNKILWANYDGRWRDSKYDEKITFVEKDNKVSIIQTFDDDSQDIKEFKKGD
jgi:broad specificity polyphosphatase/5'/3'-nucleotidase SurE